MRYALSQLPDHVLCRELTALAARDRGTTSELIAHIAEFEARRLHAPAGHPSTFAYCVHELRMSDDVAYKRVRVGRLARRFPAILPALADGSLHVSGVFLLYDFLTEATAADLLEAARNRTKREIEFLLAQRFPKPDVPTRLEAIPARAPGVPAASALEPEHAPGPSEGAPERAGDGLPAQGLAKAPGESPMTTAAVSASVGCLVPNAESPVPGRVEPALPPAPRPLIKPLAPTRYALQVTLDQETHDLLREAQDLEGHAIPAGDLCELLKRSLRSYVTGLRRTKFAATSRPRAGGRHSSANPRHIPAAVRRAVRARDGDQCTFVSERGQRCSERRGLEFDHVVPVARGGEATVEGIRLRCRTHNQYEAERTFGAGFMRNKREAARRADP